MKCDLCTSCVSVAVFWGLQMKVRSVCWRYYRHIRRLIMRGNKGLCLSVLIRQTIRLSSYLQSVTLTHALLKTMQRSCSPIITDLKKKSVCSGKLLVVFLCWMRLHTCLLHHMYLLHCMQHENWNNHTNTSSLNNTACTLNEERLISEAVCQWHVIFECISAEAHLHKRVNKHAIGSFNCNATV